MAPVVGRTAPDVDGISYPLVRVPECTCGAGPLVHEWHCGTEIDDSREIRVFWPEEA